MSLFQCLQQSVHGCCTVGKRDTGGAQLGFRNAVQVTAGGLNQIGLISRCLGQGVLVRGITGVPDLDAVQNVQG